MQKKIIALAVAAVASGAAFAQSNVTISGNLNYQFENISGSNPTMSNLAGFTAQASREGRGRVNENASNLKFSVTEDLGNGLKAMAVVESGIQATDTNNATNAVPGTGINGGSASRGGLGGRDSYIGLAGNFGTIVAGRLSVHYNSQGSVDSFGANTALAASTLAVFHGVGGAGYGLAAGGRLANTVAYVTPTVNGFNATFGYARPNASNRNNDGVVIQGANVTRKESGWTVKANFDNGPITAFASYLAHNDIAGANVLWQNTANNALTTMTNSGTTTREVRGFRMGAAYSFPMGLKVGLIYDNTKDLWRDDSGDAIAANDDLTMKRTAWAIPVSYTFGAHTLGATYAKANNLQTGGTISTADAAVLDTNGTGARYWMMGYQYAFSKRTNVGVTFARVDNDQRAAYDFFSNAAMGQNVVTTLNNTRGSDPVSVSVGLKHSF